jgi:hypothetical protein
MPYLLRLLFVLLVLTALSSCTAVRETPPIEEPAPLRPVPSILTVILKVDPKLDTLTVFDVIKGPGQLRTDYTRTIPTPPEGDLLFTFLGPEDRVIRQTSLPYPGPNRYEVPSESGVIEEITVPEAERVLTIRTQLNGGIRWLKITGRTPYGQQIDQLISLRLNQ